MSIKRSAGLGLIAGLIMALGCGDPEGSGVVDPEVAFGNGNGNGNGGGGGPPQSSSWTAVLPDLAAAPGVYQPAGQAPYESGIGRACPQDVLLVEPAGMPAGVALPGACPASGRSQVHLPDDPLTADGAYGDPDPAFTVKGNKVRASGWMRPTLNYFWDCGGDYCNLVWTDGEATPTADGVEITGSCAKLYVGGAPDTIPEAPQGGSQCPAVDRHGNPAPGFLVDLSVVVTEVP